MTPPKLLLTIATGGVLLGALLGQMANPQMKFAKKPDWRTNHEARFSSDPAQFVDTGPEDLSPATWFGPVYAQPAVFAPEPTPIPDYAPAGAEGYAPDQQDRYAAPEIDQASIEAADTAADMADASPALSIRPEKQSAGAADAGQSDETS